MGNLCSSNEKIDIADLLKVYDIYDDRMRMAVSNYYGFPPSNTLLKEFWLFNKECHQVKIPKD